MKKLPAILKWLLIAWGAISLLGILVLGLWWKGRNRDMEEGGPGRRDAMSSGDVQFILSVDPLNKAKLQSVVHSVESARAFTGDHRDAVALKVSALPVEIFQKGEFKDSHWVRGDRADATIRSALSTGKIEAWQPENSEVLTAKYFINPRTLVLHDGNLTSAELIYVNIETQMVYYIDYKF